MCLFVFENHFICYVTAQLLFLFVLFYKSNRDILCANIIIIRKIILGKIYDVKLFHYLKKLVSLLLPIFLQLLLHLSNKNVKSAFQNATLPNVLA